MIQLLYAAGERDDLLLFRVIWSGLTLRPFSFKVLVNLSVYRYSFLNTVGTLGC